MPVPASTRQYLDSHLGQAEFALKIASNFACLQGTPAHEQVRAALAQVAGARVWVKEKLEVETVQMKLHQAPLGQGLPLTRKDRVGHRWP